MICEAPTNQFGRSKIMEKTQANIPFLFPWNIRKPLAFWCFQGKRVIKRKPWPESGYVSTLFSRHISLQKLNVKMSVEQFLKLSTIFFSSLKTFNYFLQKNVFLIKQSPGAFPKINQISEVAARRWLRSSYLTDTKEVFRTLPNIMRYFAKTWWEF